MQIDIGEYHIKSNQDGYSVYTWVTPKEEGKEPYLAYPKYPGATFEQLVKHLLNRKIKDSEATTLEELRDDFGEFVELILEQFGFNEELVSNLKESLG